MIQVTPHMRVLVAIEPVDFRRGIDGLAACQGAGYGIVVLSGQSVRPFLHDGHRTFRCTNRWITSPFPITVFQG
jgi:hypothetical protein